MKLEELIKNINSGDKKLSQKANQEILAYINKVEDRCNAIVAKERYKAYPITDNFAFYDALYLFKSLFEFYSNRISAKKVTDKEVPSIISDIQPGIELYGFQEFSLFGKNLKVYIPALKQEIKTAISLLIVMWGWFYLELPKGQGGVNICITILTILQPDNITSNLKGLLRLLGCILGEDLPVSYSLGYYKQTLLQ